MRLCVFEDRSVAQLEPLTLTRPAFELWCGAASLLARQERFFATLVTHAQVRTDLVEITRLVQPRLRVNDPNCLEHGPTVLVNARWLPPASTSSDFKTPRVGVVDSQVAYVVLPPAEREVNPHDGLDQRVTSWKESLANVPAGGAMIDYPWDLVVRNTEVLERDVPAGADRDRFTRPAQVSVLGPAERLFVESSAQVDPLVLADTTVGPVIIDREARVKAFSRLEGPCYIGPKTWVLGAKVSGSTIGPVCRIGGEVEASIVHGFSNKAHEGFLGHSYVGEWVNLAAGTQVSDLRNDYQAIVMTVAGAKVNTGMTKVGSFMGDHTKTGINTLLNTGTVTGVFSQVFPSNSLPPRVMPSYRVFARGELQAGPALDLLLATAQRVMGRRGQELTTAHADLYRRLFSQLAS
jgi:UDP-N-acetylglucosamine diphosphorylase/glucosamine-1-phosphate N-acetyltransferase